MVAAAQFLPPSEVSRRQIHQRAITLHAFERDDGLYDVEALIEDVKPLPFATSTQVFPAGVPIHLMALRLTLNADLDVMQVQAEMLRTPFQSICPQSATAMQRLVGCNLLKGFRRAVLERLPAGERCAHLAELAPLLPTVAVQAIKQGAIGNSILPADDSGQRPLKLDGCHAWRSDGPLTREYLPQWYTGPKVSSGVSSDVSAPNAKLSTPHAKN